MNTITGFTFSFRLISAINGIASTIILLARRRGFILDPKKVYFACNSGLKPGFTLNSLLLQAQRKDKNDYNF
jgi:hypothetical protein